MKYTTNKNLKLPEYTDIVDVADLNENFEAIDGHMGETVTSENGAHGFRYDEENQKLEAKTSTGEWEEISLGADVSGVTATADKVLAGSKFVTADGVLTDGTMADYSGEIVTNNGYSFSSSGVNFNITSSGYYDKDSSYIFESYASMGLSADKIAEGEIVLGLTGTHSGGLKMVTGSLSRSYTNTSTFDISISSPGIVTKYALLLLSVGSSSRQRTYAWYDFTRPKTELEVPELQQVSSYTVEFSGWHGVCYTDALTAALNITNSVDTLKFPFAHSYVGASVTTISTTVDISYVLLGE